MENEKTNEAVISRRLAVIKSEMEQLGLGLMANLKVIDEVLKQPMEQRVPFFEKRLAELKAKNKEKNFSHWFFGQ